MKSLKRFVIGSLVVALVSFAGGFCTHPMMAQAASVDMEVGVSQDGSDANASGCISDPSDEISGKVVCTSDCVTKTPQAVATKKISPDSVPNILAVVPQAEQLQFPEFFSDPLDVTGTAPPFSDILFSVFKKE